MLVAAVAGPAHALKPATHASVTEAACKSAGLPKDFCRRVGTENYDTDMQEWDDLAAHAQIDGSQTACVAADAAATRVYSLAAAVHARLATLRDNDTTDRVGELDKLLGRALHTIQDDCAHHGMPNPQHAWFSLTDFCAGTETSPDLDPDAVACAKTETAAVMQLVAAQVRATGTAGILGGYSCPEAITGEGGSPNRTACDDKFLPAPWQACKFLGEASQWDGIDRTWDNARVVPALRDAFARGITAKSAPPAICGGREDAIARPVSEPTVDITAGAPTCGAAHLLCLGKADDGESPFDGDVETEDSAGCSTGHGQGALPALVLLALLVATGRCGSARGRARR